MDTSDLWRLATIVFGTLQTGFDLIGFLASLFSFAWIIHFGCWDFVALILMYSMSLQETSLELVVVSEDGIGMDVCYFQFQGELILTFSRWACLLLSINEGLHTHYFFPVGCVVNEVPVVYGFTPANQKAFLHSHQIIFFILFILLTFVNL